ncbi:predicted protein [Naegleria gruberi]|uniref:Predicted protein n=1 Tax=Naegleria gruberi TaxID=5762 RepID=D2VZ27_NAEGR|nr:uncharacterized protein NAEGRDRAFT_81782 [Naegleria gruberi]EFC37870.1 predicted protein [Naegleria gruberi]|eukprot:XP_002670614.1 predicted protein [Naegleria gruberi strain NEG-M]
MSEQPKIVHLTRDNHPSESSNTFSSSTSTTSLNGEDGVVGEQVGIKSFTGETFDSLTSPLPRSHSLPFGLSESASGFFTTTEDEEGFSNEISRIIEKEVIKEINEKVRIHKHEVQHAVPLTLMDVINTMKEGAESVQRDDFTECFRPKPPEPWNWNLFLFVGWLIALIGRYCILLPLRILLFLSGTIAFILVTLILMVLRSIFEKKKNSQEETEQDQQEEKKITTLDWLVRKSLQYYSAIWIHSMSGVIKIHGIPPVRRKNQIYVSNHTSLIDFILLTYLCGVATVGQKHGGFVGFMQDRVVSPLKNIWFERFESRDRKKTSQRIYDHINDVSNPPLLIFPEGVCVNNEYIVMFKKGVFEIEDVEICPIAIKYNKTYSDPYWSSRDESFLVHILRIMKSWCLVADVYFLEPQKKRQDEDAIQFTDRVKNMIGNKAKLISLDWDGYLKYYSPSVKLTEARQKVNAEVMKRRFLIGVEDIIRSASTNSLDGLNTLHNKKTVRFKDSPSSPSDENSPPSDKPQNNKEHKE